MLAVNVTSQAGLHYHVNETVYQKLTAYCNHHDITAKAKASKASKCAGVLGYAYDFASLPALVAPLVAPAFPLRLQFLDDPATQKWESKLQCTKIVTVGRRSRFQVADTFPH